MDLTAEIHAAKVISRLLSLCQDDSNLEEVKWLIKLSGNVANSPLTKHCFRVATQNYDKSKSKKMAEMLLAYLPDDFKDGEEFRRIKCQKTIQLYLLHHLSRSNMTTDEYHQFIDRNCTTLDQVGAVFEFESLISSTVLDRAMDYKLYDQVLQHLKLRRLDDHFVRSRNLFKRAIESSDREGYDKLKVLLTLAKNTPINCLSFSLNINPWIFVELFDLTITQLGPRIDGTQVDSKLIDLPLRYIDGYSSLIVRKVLILTPGSNDGQQFLSNCAFAIEASKSMGASVYRKMKPLQEFVDQIFQLETLVDSSHWLTKFRSEYNDVMETLNKLLPGSLVGLILSYIV